jgi:hypothetical protein
MSFNKDKTKSDQSGQQSQQMTPQRTAEQAELDRLTLEQFKEFDPIQRQLNQQGGNLINQLLSGSALPGYLNRLPGGIDENVTADIARNSIRDIQPFFQQSGLLDSGVNASVSGRISGDVRRSAEEFNLGTLLNLLNLAVGGQAQVQAPMLSQTQMLSQRLANVTPVSTTGNFSSTQSGFTQPSFLTRFNQTFGSGGAFGSGGFFGGGANSAPTAAAAAGCWVASEIFGGWNHYKTIASRAWLHFVAPTWFRELYLRFGQQVASFISNKPMIKNALRPFFESIAVKGMRCLNG